MFLFSDVASTFNSVADCPSEFQCIKEEHIDSIFWTNYLNEFIPFNLQLTRWRCNTRNSYPRPASKLCVPIKQVLLGLSMLKFSSAVHVSHLRIRNVTATQEIWSWNNFCFIYWVRKPLAPASRQVLWISPISYHKGPAVQVLNHAKRIIWWCRTTLLHFYHVF
jgi:hypothetical protein